MISESVSINCAFFNVSRGTPRSCNATITYGDNCEEQILINGVRDSANDSLLIIRLRSILQGSMSSKICGFRVYATANNTRTVTVDGNLLGKFHRIKSVYYHFIVILLMQLCHS